LGGPHEAARDLRALLDLLRDNEAAEHQVSEWKFILQYASSHLKILDPEHRAKDLVKSVEVARAKLLRQ